MSRIVPILTLLISSVCFAQPDPNIPVLRSYAGEPNEVIRFGFWIRDLDGVSSVSVVVSGPGHYLAPAVVDPNGMMSTYRGDVKFDSGGDYFLKIEADDGKIAVFAYLKFIVRKRNNIPEIG